MTERIFCTVKRGITDATAVCIYPWEKPILERIHGGEVEEVSIDAMCDLKRPVKVEKLKFSRTVPDGEKPDPAPDLRAQLEAMVVVPEDEDPALDPDAEYNRLESKYGMDKDVNVPVVGFVYGQLNSGTFALAVKEAQKSIGKPKVKAKAKAAIKLDKPLEEMSINELRSKLRNEGIEFDPTATKIQLADLLATATA